MNDFQMIKDNIESNEVLKSQVKAAAKNGFLDGLQNIIFGFVEDVFTFFRLKRTGQEIMKVVRQVIEWANRKWG
jgi:hypothetical protein